MEEVPYIEFNLGQAPYISDTTLNQMQKLIKADIKQQIIDAKEEINIITAKINGSVTISQTDTFQKVNLAQSSKLGTGFSISNGGILIGAGIENVKVTANVLIAFTNSGTFNLIIQKNSDVIARNIRSNVSGNQTSNLSKIISVKQGDILYLYVGANAGDTVNNAESMSWITVEKV